MERPYTNDKLFSELNARLVTMTGQRITEEELFDPAKQGSRYCAGHAVVEPDRVHFRYVHDGKLVEDTEYQDAEDFLYTYCAGYAIGWSFDQIDETLQWEAYSDAAQALTQEKLESAHPGWGERRRLELVKARERAAALDAEFGAEEDDVPLAPISEEVETFFLEEADAHLWDDEKEAVFQFTETHLSVLQSVKLGWDGAESGSTCFDEHEPLTNDALSEIGRRFQLSDEMAQARVYAELVWAINHFFATVEIEPGTYEIDSATADAIRAAMAGYEAISCDGDIGLDAEGNIELTTESIIVLKKTRWGWARNALDDYGAWPGPAIDPKRPYGDYSYWQIEMAEMLGWEMEKDGEGYFRTTAEQDEELQRIHFRQLSAVIAILRFGRCQG